MICREAMLVIVAFVVAGCVSMSEKAAKIQVHTQMSTLLNGCTKLGPVSSSSKWALVESLDHAVETAKVGLREATADKGGDSVVILNTDTFSTRVIM